MGSVDSIQEVLLGAAGAVSGALDATGRTGARRTDLSPTSRFFLMGAADRVSPDEALVPAALTSDDPVPSTLHVSFAASEEDEGWFTEAQPAMVSVFAFESDDDLNVGMRLGQRLDVDVAPGIHGTCRAKSSYVRWIRPRPRTSSTRSNGSWPRCSAETRGGPESRGSESTQGG